MARPGLSTKNTEKIPPGPKFWTPRIYPQNTPKKYPQNTENAHFWYYFGIFGAFSWGSRISARGVIFRYFSWKFRVGRSRGSVAGRGVLKNSHKFFEDFRRTCSILEAQIFAETAGNRSFETAESRRFLCRSPLLVPFISLSHFLRAQYDWTTGVPDNGNEWRKFRAVPRLYPLRSLVLYFV